MIGTNCKNAQISRRAKNATIAFLGKNTKNVMKEK